MTGDRRKPSGWIQWDRIRPDYETGMPPRLVVLRENAKRDAEGEARRLTVHQLCNQANLKGWTRPWQQAC